MRETAALTARGPRPAGLRRRGPSRFQRELVSIHNPITPRSGRREPRVSPSARTYYLPQIPVLDEDRGCSCEIVHRVGIRWHGPVSRESSHWFRFLPLSVHSSQLAPARDANRSSGTEWQSSLNHLRVPPSSIPRGREPYWQMLNWQMLVGTRAAMSL